MQDKKHWTKLIHGATLVLVLGSAATIVSAQGTGGPGGGTPQPLAVHQLKPNIYWVEGGGGNSAIIVGNNGVIVVDTKTTAAAGSTTPRLRARWSCARRAAAAKIPLPGH